jgi:mycothione reductase
MLGDRFDAWDVAIVEPRHFGGTCLNAGCIPTKMLVHTADLVEQARGSGRLGVDVGDVAVRWPDVRDRVFGRIDARAAWGHRWRSTESPRTTVYDGAARFVGPRRLAVTGADGRTTEISGDHVVVAAGGRPVVPDVIAASGVPFDTSETVMRIDAVPERLVILGSGYIAAEFAHVFSSMGSAVTVVARGNALLSSQDEAVSTQFTKLAEEKWDVRLGRQVTAAAYDAGTVRLTCDDGSEVEGDRLLVAVGRTPNSDGLDLARGGIQVLPDGRVRTDAYQRTTAPGVWAIGDITSDWQLKHVANREARTVAHNLLHPDRLQATDYTAVPWAVFTEPQIAGVGMTEQQARAVGADYVSYTHEFRSVAYGWAMEDTTGFCKLLADRRTGLLLGAHVLGPQAATLIQPLVQAMTFGQRVDAVAHAQFWIHPALTEVVENALLGLPLGAPDDALEGAAR